MGFSSWNLVYMLLILIQNVYQISLQECYRGRSFQNFDFFQNFVKFTKKNSTKWPDVIGILLEWNNRCPLWFPPENWRRKIWRQKIMNFDLWHIAWTCSEDKEAQCNMAPKALENFGFRLLALRLSLVLKQRKLINAEGFRKFRRL